MDREATRTLFWTVVAALLYSVMGGAWLYSIDGWPLVSHVFVGTPIVVLFFITLGPTMYFDHLLRTGTVQLSFSTVFGISLLLFGTFFYGVALPALFIMVTVSGREDSNALLADRRPVVDYPSYIESLDFLRVYLTEASIGPIIAAGPIIIALLTAWKTTRNAG